MKFQKSTEFKKPKSRKQPTVYIIETNNHYESERIQTALFELGLGWGAQKQIVLHTNEPYLVIRPHQHSNQIKFSDKLKVEYDLVTIEELKTILEE